MPLKEKTIVELREEVVVRVVRDGFSVSEAARMYGLSRPTVYEWLRRYDVAGREGLNDRSRAPHSCPHRTPSWIEQRLIEERCKWGFGSKKILQRLCEEEPQIDWPGRATIDAILKRAHLVVPRRRRSRRQATPFARRYNATRPGELSTIDFKGQFRLRNGRYCYPLTMADYVSRYLIVCQALESTHLEPTWKAIEQALREHGLPQAMRSDTGTPFAGSGIGRFSTLSVRLMKLGIQPIFGRPGKPQDNAVHERMHKTLKERTALPPAHDLSQQQLKFDAFRQMFNEERPHEGIGMQRPARLYRGSSRPFPSRPPKIEYDCSFEVRRVSSSGSIRWRSHALFLSNAFSGESIGLIAVDDARWDVYFGQFWIAQFHESAGKFV